MASFDIDLDNMLEIASELFNALMPVFAIGIGIALGIGLAKLVSAEVRKIV